MSNLHLFLILAALQAADMATTVGVLKRGGREANPFMAWVFSRVGTVPGFLATKTAFLAVLWIYLDQVHLYAMAGLAVIYAVVVVNNAKVLKGLMRAKQ